MNNVQRTCLAGLLAGAVWPVPASAESNSAALPTVASVAQVCAQLSGIKVGGTAELVASVVAASGPVPAYCKLNGTLLPKLNFEVRLPDNWNGKLYYQGGGALNGSIPVINAQTIAALLKGYAAVASDSGHQASPVDASWALNDPYAAQLFGSLSVPTVMPAAREILRTAYGKYPTRSYFEGCSNGGREGLMNVQRYPSLFNGVIARAPAYNIVGFVGQWNRVSKALAVPGGALPRAKVQLLAQSMRTACDALDGITDGVVSNPAACTKAMFNPASLRCKGGADTGPTCLSDTQLAAVDAITSGSRFGAGASMYHDAGHYITGNDDDPGAWATWITGDGDVTKARGYQIQDSTVRTFFARDLAVNSLTYTQDHNPATLFYTAALLDATSTDIRSFVGSGGKLIFWHGGSDAAFSPASTAEYYSGLPAALGSHAAMDAAVRYYVAPGVNHCGGGQGADTSDLLEALDAWVTKGIAPETLAASKVNATGGTDFTRPLCRYPQYPRYTGQANDKAAAKFATNYTCTTP